MRAILLCLLLVACATPASAPAQNLRVRSGESIAAALELAKPGTVIEVEPGVYHEALVVDTPNVTLRGIVSGPERPVLDGRGVLNDGVIASGSPFTMTGFAVRHYKGNGVSTQGVDGVFLTDLVIDDTGLYGVYPVQSRNISITHCTVTRIRDAGIYVGESQGALVAMNYVHHNVAGIEIENTNDAEVRDNLAHDNTAGILVFVLPGKVLKEGKRSRVHRNWVVRNNTPNFGDPESIVGSLPFGIGILLMGADDTVVENNQVRENASLGIAITRLAAEHAKKDPPLEPMTDRARIVSNHLDANGTAPHPSITQGYGGGGDFGWDGTGVDNCADLADGARTVGAPIGACLDSASAPSADAMHGMHGEMPSGHAAGAAARPLGRRGRSAHPRHALRAPSRDREAGPDRGLGERRQRGPHGDERGGHAAEPRAALLAVPHARPGLPAHLRRVGQLRVPVPAAPRPGRDARCDGDGGEVAPQRARRRRHHSTPAAEPQRRNAEPGGFPQRQALEPVEELARRQHPHRHAGQEAERAAGQERPEADARDAERPVRGREQEQHESHHERGAEAALARLACAALHALGQARHDRLRADPARECEGEGARAGRARAGRARSREREARPARRGS